MTTTNMLDARGRPARSPVAPPPCTTLALLLATALAALTLAASGVQATDLDSTPLKSAEPAGVSAHKTTTESLAKETSELDFAPGFAQKVTVGLNQEISRFNTDSTFIPPDTMGAVGPRHIVEIINGNFEIFDKATGASLDSRTLDNFWTATVGLAGIQRFSFDPRVIYDPDSGRWFAVSIDSSDTDGDGATDSANFIYLARTDTDDPEGDWDGVRFAADTVPGADFHDYPTLAVDAAGVYICTQDFPIGAGSNAESCYSIPKADLIQAAPSVARLTRFEATPAGLPTVDGSIQPAVNRGPATGRTPLLGTSGGFLVRSNIFGSQGAGATLGTVMPIGGDPGHAGPPPARQPHPTGWTIENVAPRFVGNVIQFNSSLWAVHAVQGSGANSALRWYEIDETSDTVIQTGLIDDPNRDFHEPSIAVNAQGDVFIGYTCSGPTLSLSVCVSVGTTSGGVTSFEAPQILKLGDGYYARTATGTRNRWGDYSATVLDPSDPCTFYTFQEFVAVSGTNTNPPAQPATVNDGLWGTQVTELTVNACANNADLRIHKDCKPDNPMPAGGEAICEITVENLGPTSALGVRMNDRHISNGTFQFGTVTTTRGTCTATPNPQNGVGDVDCALGRLAAGDRVTIRVPVTANTPQDINDRATVSSDTHDPDFSNNEATDSVSVYAAADLSITKSDSPDPVVAGTNLTYELNVSNSGPSSAVNVRVEDRLPAGVSLVSVNASGGGSCNAGVPGDSSQPTVCNFDTLAAAASRTMTIVVKVLPQTTGVLHNDARVSSQTADTNNANDKATTTTTVNSEADVSVTKTDSPDPVSAGAELTYTLKVSNAGPSTATEVQLTDNLPPEVTFTSATISGGTGTCASLGGGTISCDLNDLDPGASVSVVIKVMVGASVPDGTTITDLANATSAADDPNAANNTVSEDTLVVARADLWIDKTGNFLASNPSGTVEYRLTVHNDPGCSSDDPQVCGNGGPSDAQNVVVIDNLPLDPKKFVVQYVSEDCVYDKPSHTVTCTTAVLPAGSQVLHVIQGDIKGKATVVRNTASVSSSTTDPTLGNNSDTYLITVQGGKGDPGGPKK